ALERATEAEREFTVLETTIAGLSVGEEDLDAAHAAAATAVENATAVVTALETAERDAERERAALSARLDALQMGLTRKDGSAELLAASDRLSGVVGSVAALVAVQPGWEAA